MICRYSFLLAIGLMLTHADRLGAAAVDEIIPQSVFDAYGLTRGWMEQMSVDSSRARVTHVVLDGNALFVQTDRSQIQAFDAETGRPLWSEAKQVGNPNLVSFPFSVNHSLLAAINGSHLYILNRHTGELLWDKVLESGAGAGPTLGDQELYVPLGNGKVVAYRLKPIVNPLKELGKTGAKGDSAYSHEGLKLSQEFSAPIGLQSTGVVQAQPTMARQTADEEYVVWATDAGYVFIGVFDHGLNSFVVKYRIALDSGVDVATTYVPPPAKPASPPEAGKEADAADKAKPAENEDEKPAEKDANEKAEKEDKGDGDAAAKTKAPKHDKLKHKVDTSSGVVFAVTRKGLAYAIAERTGETIWQFAASEPIVQPAAVIGGNAYITTQLGGLHCLDAANGARKWWSPGIRQFVAQSKDRLYGLDRTGRLMILDPQNGATLGVMPINAYDPSLVMNAQNDRLYMVSRGGLIQSFHEPSITQPLVYATPHLPPPEKARATKKAAEEGAEHPKAAPKPAGERPAAAPAADQPKPKPKPNADPLEKPEKPVKAPRTPKGK